MTLTELKETYTAHTALEKETMQIVMSNATDYESFEDFLKDLLTHGCVSGMISELIYYADTTAFTKRHAKEINELLSNTLSMYGMTSPAQLFGNKWDNEDFLALSTQNQNLLAWFAFEETCIEIGISLDLEVAA